MKQLQTAFEVIETNQKIEIAKTKGTERELHICLLLSFHASLKFEQASFFNSCPKVMHPGWKIESRLGGFWNKVQVFMRQ